MRWSQVLFCLLILICGGLTQADDAGASVTEGPIEESIVQPTVVVTAEPTQESTEQFSEEVFTEQVEEIFKPPAEEFFAEPTVSPQETIAEGETNTTGTDDSSGEEVTVTIPLDSLTVVTGNETPSLTLEGGADESNTTKSSPESSGIPLDASTNLTTSLDSSPRMFSSSLSSTSPDSGTSPVVVTLGTIIVTGTSGTKLSSAGGSGYSYNSADGGYFIITDGGDYYLDEDISTSHTFAIEIQASGVTLDGNGHTITYTGLDNSGTSGVLIDPIATRATVTNFTGITGFEHGIPAYAEDAVIEHNTVYGNDYGIYSDKSSATIYDNDASRNVYGIWSSGDYANITDNIACFNNNTTLTEVGTNSWEVTGGYGIYSSGDYATIAENNASFNSVNASREVTGTQIIDYKVNATGGYGISSTESDARIRDNTVNGNSATALFNTSASTVYSFAIAYSNSATATGGYGIQATGNNTTITNNNANVNSATAILNASSSNSKDYVASVDSNSATATGGYGIEATGNNVTITNNTANSNSATALLNASSSSPKDIAYAKLNSASATGGFGIEATGNNATIADNNVSNNSAMAILNASAIADFLTLADSNSASATGGYGIEATGNNATITNNTADDNNATVSATALKNGVPVATTTSLTGGFGIDATSDDANITDNRLSGNRYGIGISDSSTDLTLTGNYLNQSTEAGLYISEDGGGGTGYIFNNYFGNDLNVCATALSAEQYHWNNTEPRLGTKGLTVAAAPGTNVVGGSYLAGNYWSDENGNGWSDQQTPTETGYSLTPYKVVSGVYDENPLIRTGPTISPTPQPPVTPTTPFSSTRMDPATSYFASQPDNTSDSTGINFVIVNVTIPKGTIPGDNTRLTVSLKNTGSILLSPMARIVLEPVNELAKSLGEQPVVYQNGEYILSFQLPVPTGQGSSVYIFNPIQVTRDPGTGQDIRIPVGGPVQFTVTVGANGAVTVQSP